MGQSQPNDIHANQKTHNHLSRRMIDMKTHEIKCWPKYFKLIWDGTKSFEVRKNDRDYKVGDAVKIYEWDPKTKIYTGRLLVRIITYKLQGEVGLPKDTCILQLR